MQVDADTRWVNTAVQTVFHLLDSYFERQGIAMTEDHADPANQWFILGTKQVSPAQLEEAERWVNEIIHQDLSVTFSYVKGSDYPDPDYQKFDQVRLVHIGDVSVIPCGTCHVNHTAQLQSFAILGTEKAAGGHQGLNCDRPGRHGTLEGRPPAAKGGRHGVEHDPGRGGRRR